MKLLESSYEVEEDPYCTVNLLDLIGKTEEKEENLEAQSTSLSEPSEYSPLNIQIEPIKVSLTSYYF
jgi:hypothetical protein